MAPILFFILSLVYLNTASNDLTDISPVDLNTINTDEIDLTLQPELPPEEPTDYSPSKQISSDTEIEFDDPISSVNIDYLSNAILLQFRKQKQKQRQQALNKNFMRFGKRRIENTFDGVSKNMFNPTTRFGRSNAPDGMRDSRGDNFMRFGRSTDGSKNPMRLGRSSTDFMRFGRSPSDFMRFGRPSSDFMRFGRAPNDFMRFGRNPSDFMRFGRTSPNFMRLGRTPTDFMRFGRASGQNQNRMRLGRTNGVLRFGRSDQSLLRFGKPKGYSRSDIDNNFMRFGRPDSFMRFGRSPTSDVNTSFMRFGKREKEETISPTELTHSNNDSKFPTPIETSTNLTPQDLDNYLEPIDMMYMNSLSDSLDNSEQ